MLMCTYLANAEMMGGMSAGTNMAAGKASSNDDGVGADV